MTHYGQRIDGYDPIATKIYKACTFYFDNPDMYKVKDDDNISIYMRKTSKLMNKYRYIIVIAVKNEDPLGSSRKLENLEWYSLQTRTLDELHNVPNYSYKPKKYGFPQIKIKRVFKNSTESVYQADRLPLTVRIFHTRTDTDNQYSDNGTIGAALETFETIFTLKNN